MHSICKKSAIHMESRQQEAGLFQVNMSDRIISYRAAKPMRNWASESAVQCQCLKVKRKKKKKTGKNLAMHAVAKLPSLIFFLFLLYKLIIFAEHVLGFAHWKGKEVDKTSIQVPSPLPSHPSSTAPFNSKNWSPSSSTFSSAAEQNLVKHSHK